MTSPASFSAVEIIHTNGTRNRKAPRDNTMYRLVRANNRPALILKST